MKKSVMLMTIAFAFAIFGGSAGAAIIFTDTFDRPPFPNNTIGNGWTKTFNDSADVQLRALQPAVDPNDGELWMRDVNATVTNSASTVSFSNIQCMVKYNGNDPSESEDKLRFSWSDGMGTFNLLATAAGLDFVSGGQTATFVLPAGAENLAGFRFRLSTEVSTPEEAARIREVTLTGNPVPIPGAVWLLGSGLIGILGIRRKIRQ